MSEELFQVPPQWEVTTREDGFHVLSFGGVEQEKRRSMNGLNQLRDMAALFTRKGKVPVGWSAPGAKAKPPEGEATNDELNFSQPTTTDMSKTTTTTTGGAAAPMTELRAATGFRRYRYNREISPERVKEMKASIEEMGGIIEPLLARPIAGEELLEIICGETRWLGACAISADYQVPVIIREMTDKDASKVHAVSNFQRSDLDDIEAARAMQHMKDTGWTIDEIMVSIGREKDYIYRRLKLLKLDPTIQEALREKTMTILTAEMLLKVPEDQRPVAMKAVMEPTHSTVSLPEREAIELLNRQFVKPAEQSSEWEKKRKFLEKEHPGCEWLSYEDAQKVISWDSGYTRASAKPAYQYLSDAAKSEELVVPTWGELAERHGAKRFIGMDGDGNGDIFVQTASLVEAEKARCDDKPGECIFTHDLAVAEAKQAAAQKKEAEELKQQGLKAEKAMAIEIVAGRGKPMAAKVETALALAMFDEFRHNYQLDEDETLVAVLGLTPVGDDEEIELYQKRIDDAGKKFIKAHENGAFAGLGLLVAAYELERMPTNYNADGIAGLLFKTKLATKKDFPLLGQVFDEAEAARKALDEKLRLKEIEENQKAADAA